MSSGFNVEGTAGPVSGMDPNGNVWMTGTLSCAAYNVSGAGTQAAATYTGVQTFNSGAGLNTNAEAAANVLSTLLIAPQETTGTQIGDLTRDYMCYVYCTTGGTNNTLTIGPTSAGTAATIFANATMAAGTTFSFRLPASWYIFFNGTGTLGKQTGVAC